MVDARRGWVRGLVTLALLVGRARAGEPRALPENARPDPARSTEGYPAVGGSQRRAIVGEVAGASVRRLLTRPLRGTGEVLGRGAERLAVRAREAGPGRLGCGSGDGRLDAGAGTPEMGARLTLLPTSEAAVRGLLGSIEGATRRVDLMIYGWEDDPTGREVAAALTRAAGRGVEVRLVVDRGGFLIHNRGAADGEGTFLDGLKATPNVRVIEPGDPFARFDHRKLAVVDGRVVWSGGMILTEVARRRWDNLAFLAEGEVVGPYAGMFEERWREVGGEPGGPIVGDVVPAGDSRVRLVRTDVGERSLKAAVYHAVDHARGRITLENPYFSDEILVDKLVAARRRGVEVRAVLTVRGNERRLDRFEVLTANRLLRGGVRVWLAPGMTHVKGMTVDGWWSYVGTGNFDELSLRNNREAALAVTSEAVARELEVSVFGPHITRAQELRALLPAPEGRLWLELFALWY